MAFRQTEAGLRLGGKDKYRRPIYSVRGVRLHIHSYMYNSLYTQDDWFLLRAEIWSWRQDYGGRTHSFSLTLSWLPPLGGPRPFTECFFTPEEDDLPPLTFPKQPLHSSIRTSDEQLHNTERWRELFVWQVEVVWRGLTVVPLPDVLRAAQQHPISGRTATLQSLPWWMLGEGHIPSTNSKSHVAFPTAYREYRRWWGWAGLAHRWPFRGILKF